MAAHDWVTFDPPEALRAYHYSSDDVLSIPNVTRMKISESGNHYVETQDGHKFIVAPGWRYIHLVIDKWTF